MVSTSAEEVVAPEAIPGMRPRHETGDALPVVLLNVVVFAAYAVTGWLGLRLPYYGEQVTLVWAPAAIALVAIVLAGPIVVPGISLAAFAVNFVVVPKHPALAVPIAVGNTLGPTIA